MFLFWIKKLIFITSTKQYTSNCTTEKNCLNLGHLWNWVVVIVSCPNHLFYSLQVELLLLLLLLYFCKAIDDEDLVQILSLTIFLRHLSLKICLKDPVQGRDREYYGICKLPKAHSIFPHAFSLSTVFLISVTCTYNGGVPLISLPSLNIFMCDTRLVLYVIV